VANSKARPQLRDAILRHLREAGSDSISGAARALSTLEGAPVHRLTVAGHLAAMTEEGILREVDRPPSKHYQVREEQRFKTMHEHVGAVVGTLNLPAPDRAAAAVATLGHLFGRPIFLAELQACGFSTLGRGIEIVETSEEHRRAIRHLFREDGPHPKFIPRADPLLQVPPAGVSSTVLQEGMRRLLLRTTHTLDLCLSPEDRGGTQARLQLGGANDS
jgi:hypothetical protein